MRHTIAPGVIVPPADTNGYWHYIYVARLPNSRHWYGGKHTTKNLDDGYLGSGQWIRNNLLRNNLTIEIISFHASEHEAFIAETKLVNWDVIDNDKFCRNRAPGGNGGPLGGGNKLIREQIKNFDLDAYNAKIADGMAKHRQEVQELIAKSKLKNAIRAISKEDARREQMLRFLKNSK